MDTTYYVRAYAINDKGIAYGEEVTLNFEVPPYVTVSGTNLIVAKEDAGKGDWYTGLEVCESSTLAGFNDWRLPTYSELQILYNNRDLIGGFKSANYCSSEVSEHFGSYYTWYVDFSNGNSGDSYDCSRCSSSSFYFRCVRTAQ